MQEHQNVTLDQLDWQPLLDQAQALLLRGDFQAAAEQLHTQVMAALDQSLCRLLEQVVCCDRFHKALWIFGGKLGMGFRGFEATTVILPGGTRFRFKSPYFHQSQATGAPQAQAWPRQVSSSWRLSFVPFV